MGFPICLGFPIRLLGLAITIGSRQLRLLGRSCPGALVLEGDVARPPGAQDPVPDGEKGLREVGLDTPALVVDVVVGRVVARDVLQRIEGERVAAVVIDRLHHAADEEEHAQTGAEERHLVGEAGAEGIQDESLDRVIVEGAVRIGDVETVVAGMPIRCWTNVRVVLID